MSVPYVTEGEPSENSPAEQRLFEIQKTGRLTGWVFNKHLVLDGHHMYVDLAHEGVKLAIEIDGFQHNTYANVLRDFDRDQRLGEHGWTVKRFSHAYVMQESDLVVEWAEKAVIELPMERNRRAAVREANRAAAARRRLSDLVHEVIEFEALAEGYSKEIKAARAKHYWTKLYQITGARAEDRTEAQHQQGYDALLAHFEKYKAEKTVNYPVPEDQETWWCVDCTTYHFVEEDMNQAREHLLQALSDDSGTELEDIIQQVEYSLEYAEQHDGVPMGCWARDESTRNEIIEELLDEVGVSHQHVIDDATHTFWRKVS